MVSSTQRRERIGPGRPGGPRVRYLLWLAYVLVVTASSSWACRRETRLPEPAAASDAAVAVTIEWAGCAGIRKGPVCEMGTDRKLTLWVDRTGIPWLAKPASFDGKFADARIEPNIDGGTRLTVEVPQGARELRLDVPGNPRPWALRLGDAQTHVEVDRLLALGRSGKYPEALAALETLRPSLPPGDRGPADAAMARMALQVGQVDLAESTFRQAIAAAKAEGRIADVVQDGSALLWALVARQRRFVEARALLDEMRPFGEQYPEGRMLIDFNVGTLATTTADIRSALERYRAAERPARRLERKLADSASDAVAGLLGLVGRVDEMATLLQGLPMPKEPCARSQRLLNLAWALMERAARRETSRDSDAAATLAEAETASRACPEPHNRLLALIHAAEYLMDTGDEANVEAMVREIEAAKPDRDLLLSSWRKDVLGRWLLRKGRAAEALAAFTDQARLARGADLLDEAFRGEVGAGRALLALNRRATAIPRLRAAQDLLETMLGSIPLAEGRGSFLGGHDDGVRTLVRVLFDGRAFDEALRVARWARASEIVHAARIDRLAHLAPKTQSRWDDAVGRYQRIRSAIEREAENDWTLPAADLGKVRAERAARAEQARAVLDQAYQLLIGAGRARSRLSSPGAREVFLAFFPETHGWLALAATTKTVKASRVASAAIASTKEATRALAAFDNELRGAERIRLFPYGLSNQVDWPAVQWKGKPLLASFEVEYGLDVPEPAAAAPATGLGSTALLVANPTGDLPAAGPEAETVARALRGWQVTRLEGEAATRESALEALPRARLFHYAGHAEVAGSQGLSSALLMKGNGRIEVGDLLALPSVPDLVILSACEAAGTATQHPSLMGLAQAFVAAGARAVIAPARPVGDVVARSFAEAFYAALIDEKHKLGRPLDDVRAAFRLALLGVSRGQGKEAAGWESFRLLVP